MNMEFKTQIPRDTQAIDSLLLLHIHTKGTHLQQPSTHTHRHTHILYKPLLTLVMLKGAEQNNQNEVIKMKERKKMMNADDLCEI